MAPFQKGPKPSRRKDPLMGSIDQVGSSSSSSSSGGGSGGSGSGSGSGSSDCASTKMGSLSWISQ